jgi:hypothetical protein
MFLQNKINESFEQSEIDYSINETVKYSSSSSSINHDNSPYSSKIKSDTNQTLTYNEVEKLLTMVQRSRN